MIPGENKRQKPKVLVMELLDSAVKDGKFRDGCFDWRKNSGAVMKFSHP